MKINRLNKYLTITALIFALSASGCGASKDNSGTASESSSATQQEQTVDGAAKDEETSDTDNTATNEEADDNSSGNDQSSSDASEKDDSEDEAGTEENNSVENDTDKNAESAGSEQTGENTDEETADSASGSYSAGEIYAAISGKVTLDAPMELPADYVRNYFGIDLSKAADSIFVMSEASTSVETVVIIKAADRNDLAAMQSSLQAVVTQRGQEMENYLPEQYEIVKKAVLKTKGDYVYLVISPNAGAISSVIDGMI